TAAGRTYDGSNTAVINLGSLSGLIGSESLSLSATGLFDSKNAGNRSATATYLLGDDSATGGLAANYSLAPTAGLSATIAKANLSITASSDTKIYDGTTISSVTPIFSGLVSGDSLSPLSQSFNSKDVLTANSLTVNNGFTLNDGNSGANYSVALISASGTITRRPQSTWSAPSNGLSSGLWSDPANWDALPSAANVAAVLIPSGSAAVSYDAAAGSTELQSLINNQALSLDGGSLAVGGTTTVGSGATLSLNGGGFTTAALSNAGLVNGSGALLLDGLYSESGSGRLGSGFSRVEIIQSSGPLSLQGVGASGPVTLSSLNGPLSLSGAISSAGAPITLLASGPLSLSPGASLTSPGGTLSLFGFGTLDLQGASLDASGASAGGTVQLNGASIALSGTSVNTSGAADGGTIRIGSIELAGASGLPAALPSTVAISNSSLVADPPGLGGSINVNGTAITIGGSSFNVFGLSGGAITIGSAATASLNLDALTSLLGGGGASFRFSASTITNSASFNGGVLTLNGQQQQRSNPLAPLLPVVIAQQAFNPLQPVVNRTNADSSPLPSPTVSQSGAPAGDQLVSVTLTDASSMLDSSDTTENPHPSQPAAAEPQAGSNAASPAASGSGAPATALAAQPAQPLPAQQVTAQYTAAEQKTAESTATKLGLTTAGSTGTGFNVPTPAEIQAVLRQAIEAIRQQFSP
ncbi:MAG: YDG domain-containing protein, partial [Cyanobacteriota bacterium]